MNGIKHIISLKQLNYTSPNAIIDNATLALAIPSGIANAFNKYFSTTAIDIQSFFRYSKKQFFDVRFQSFGF